MRDLTPEIVKEAASNHVLDALEFYPDDRFYQAKYYKFLQEFCRREQPALCVELGVCTGGGSLYMALGSPGSKIVGVDLSMRHHSTRTHVLERFPNVDFWYTDTISAAAFIPEFFPNNKIEVLFIDSSHSQKMAMYEYAAYSSLLAESSIVFMDDIMHDGVDKAFNDIPGKYKVELNDLHWAGPNAGGFGAIIT